MRYVRFSHGPGAALPGVVDGTSVRPFDATVASLEAFIAATPAERATSVAKLGKPIPLTEVVLRAPLQPVKNVFCVGRNYLAHAEEGAKAQGIALELPAVPTFFTKAPTAIADPGEVLALDGALSPQYDWEAELGVIIGTRCRDVSEADALSMVFGYTCFNDVTARDLQRAHGQWFKGKSLDHTGPIGPWIVDAADVGDPQNLSIELRVNGVPKQHASTASMIFSVRAIIASLSAGLTLEPGDIIASGTPEGVGYARTPPEFLADGDIMEVEIENIGMLRNAANIQIGRVA
jgi:2-keto-4-pentenoate hydratase/2-oxohepta-3-ene-1,7-dioic acid hydratase in catechol pathway